MQSRSRACLGPRPLSLASSLACLEPKGAHVVMICATEPRMSYMTLGDMFESNACIMLEIANACIESCPTAIVLVVSQPLESLVPLIAQAYKKKGVYDPRKLLGVTSPNVIRSNSMLARFTQCSPLEIMVPVLGGNSPDTIVPVFSSAFHDPMAISGQFRKRAEIDRALAPYRTFDPTDIVKASIQDMTNIVRSAEDHIFRSKNFTDGASVTGATAAAETAIKVVIGLTTNQLVVDHAFVETDRVDGVTYSTIPLQYGPDGVWKQYARLPLSRVEQELMAEALEPLKNNIKEGDEYLTRYKWE